MQESLDIHKVFADYFKDTNIRPFAYALSKKLSEGHVCLDIVSYNNFVLDSSDSLLENPYINKGEYLIIENIKDSKWISFGLEDVKPFVLKDNNLYFHKYFEYESNIITKIEQFIDYENNSDSHLINTLSKHKEFIKELFNDDNDISLSKEERPNWQAIAALTSISKQFSIITGGPGTGKTTTVAKILALLYTVNPDLKVVLAAPTGKAAARMMESLKGAKERIKSLSEEIKDKYDSLEYYTIHRLLGYIKGSHYFKHNESNMLNYDVIIVDESSMIDISLMSKLMSAIKCSSKVIFLGDKDQLASVEAGSVFGDICLAQKENMNCFKKEHCEFFNSFIINPISKLPDEYLLKNNYSNLLSEHIVELKRSHRFKGNEGIGKFSRHLINGTLNEEDFIIETNPNIESVKILNDYQASDIYAQIDIFKDYIVENDIQVALKKLNNIRFLCAVREGRYGVYAYNALIEKYLEKKKLLKPKLGFYENQPIIISKNNYSLDLFNGDVGIIRKDEKGDYKAYFEDSLGQIKTVLPGYISSFETVFAMTIHKSQGSEFDSVVVILPENEQMSILTSELMYTGITRGKKNVFVVGQVNTIINSAKKRVERASGITERIINRV